MKRVFIIPILAGIALSSSVLCAAEKTVDRKSVVQGKRVDLGGSRSIKKKKKINEVFHTTTHTQSRP